ncbi:MAG TPA: universal stress protein [Dehalococcoidia bacterium]|nr:universal stress protein [Dehalococcoidia bacterium]
MAGLTALIPLDGTKLSEHSYEMLPLLKLLGFDKIRVVTVWESAWEEAETGRDMKELSEITEKGRNYLSAYVDQQKERIQAAGFEVEALVHVGRPADEVLQAAEGVDLVLIATHGRTGIARWWLGSVADQVIKDSKCPTLVVGPNVEADLATYKVNRILVPLDGSEMAEHALPVAVWIAKLTGAELDIVRCMSLTAVTYDPSMSMYSADLITSMEDAVREYLRQVADRVKGVKFTTTMIMGSAGETLLERMKDVKSDLVITTSHGRTGVTRAALGSVTDRLLHGSAPVLVFRPSEVAAGGLITAAEAATVS